MIYAIFINLKDCIFIDLIIFIDLERLMSSFYQYGFDDKKICSNIQLGNDNMKLQIHITLI